MITAQDIREKTFATVRRDGYDMDVVDAFLDELANDTEAAQKENAVLKSKMKVLVNKIEEYRASEEATQRAILSAQKLAIQIESDARARAAAIIADAEKQAQAKSGAIAQATTDEEALLAAAKAATAKYVEGGLQPPAPLPGGREPRLHARPPARGGEARARRGGDRAQH